MGNPEPRISQEFISEVLPQLKNGDILLSRENWKLTNPLVPGFWGHAAVYYNEQVVEAIGDYTGKDGKLKNGVRADDVLHWMYAKDSIAVLRAQEFPEEMRELIGQYAAEEIGKPYDYGFEPNTDAFYCSELVVYAYNKLAADTDISPIEHRDQFGVQTTTPQDLYDIDIFSVCWKEIN